MDPTSDSKNEEAIDELVETPEEFDYGLSVITQYDPSLAQNKWRAIFSLQQLPILLIALATFCNGVVGVAEPLFQRLARHPKFYDMIVPYGIYHWSRSLSLLFG